MLRFIPWKLLNIAIEQMWAATHQYTELSGQCEGPCSRHMEVYRQ